MLDPEALGGLQQRGRELVAVQTPSLRGVVVEEGRIELQGCRAELVDLLFKLPGRHAEVRRVDGRVEQEAVSVLLLERSRAAWFVQVSLAESQRGQRMDNREIDRALDEFGAGDC